MVWFRISGLEHRVYWIVGDRFRGVGPSPAVKLP